MSQEIVSVLLKEVEDKDILVFDIKENDDEDDYIVSLGESSDSQTQLKRIFSRILVLAKNSDVSLILSTEQGYSKKLIEEVCSEYIKSLDDEIKVVREKINEQMQDNTA